MIGGDAVRPLLQDALVRRRRELTALITGPAGAAARGPAVPAQPATDADEALRRLMVVLWPAIRRAPHDGTARDAFLAQLARLEEAARSGDPRFLDAWNHAYEAIAAWPEPLREEGMARWTLERYARLLDHHLASLSGAA